MLLLWSLVFSLSAIQTVSTDRLNTSERDPTYTIKQRDGNICQRSKWVGLLGRKFFDCFG